MITSHPSALRFLKIYAMIIVVAVCATFPVLKFHPEYTKIFILAVFIMAAPNVPMSLYVTGKLDHLLKKSKIENIPKDYENIIQDGD